MFDRQLFPVALPIKGILLVPHALAEFKRKMKRVGIIDTHASHFHFISGSIPITILVKQVPRGLGVFRRGKEPGDVL